MEEAARARNGAREAVADIGPERLQSVIDDRLATGSMIPGVLTILSARLVDPTVDGEEVESRAVGVQLIYEGLRLTRALVREEPWNGEDVPDDIQADIDVLAADVLVARGFRLLARTQAADRAVETVRRFGREQTQADPPGMGLEACVFELAVVAGATVTGDDPPLPLRQYAVGLARARGDPPLPVAEEGLPEQIEDVLHRVGDTTSGDGVRPRSPD